MFQIELNGVEMAVVMAALSLYARDQEEQSKKAQTGFRAEFHARRSEQADALADKMEAVAFGRTAPEAA